MSYTLSTKEEENSLLNLQIYYTSSMDVLHAFNKRRRKLIAKATNISHQLYNIQNLLALNLLSVKINKTDGH